MFQWGTGVKGPKEQGVSPTLCTRPRLARFPWLMLHLLESVSADFINNISGVFPAAVAQQQARAARAACVRLASSDHS